MIMVLWLCSKKIFKLESHTEEFTGEMGQDLGCALKYAREVGGCGKSHSWLDIYLCLTWARSAWHYWVSSMLENSHKKLKNKKDALSRDNLSKVKRECEVPKREISQPQAGALGVGPQPSSPLCPHFLNYNTCLSTSGSYQVQVQS